MNTTSDFNSPEHNPINSLSLESQLSYINFIRQLDLMSHEQLKETTILLFQNYMLKDALIKEMFKEQLLGDLNRIM